MKIVIFENPDDTITVRAPIQNPTISSPARRRKGESEDEHFERLVTGPNRKGGTSVAAIDHADLPAGHEHFKPARRWNGLRVDVDMPKARAIHMARIRPVRDRELVRLSNDWMKALGQKNQPEADRIEAKRQALRDIPQAFDLSGAATPKELAALWPDGLPKT